MPTPDRHAAALTAHQPPTEPKPICQYCLADPRHTGLGELGKPRCPVCGAPYSGPRRDAEYRVLVEAGLVACGD